MQKSGDSYSLLNRQTSMILMLIVGFSFLVKFFLSDFTIQNDGYVYYSMAQSWGVSNTFNIDDSIYLHNFGFPLLHGVLYYYFDISYQTHIMLTILYSVASLPFAFFFLRSFVKPQYAFLGVILLAFNFRLIENAGFGITEPLFLLCVWASFYFSLKSNKLFLLSILFATLSILVRFEGIVVFLFVLYQCLVKRNLFHILMSIPSLMPFYFTKSFSINKIEESQYVSKHLGVIEVHARHEIEFITSEFSINILPKIVNSVIYFGWSLFPEFVLLLSFGIYAIHKRKIGISLLMWIIIFGCVGMYAYLDAYDTRYFFLSFLFMDLLCMIGLQTICSRIFNKKLVNCKVTKS